MFLKQTNFPLCWLIVLLAFSYNRAMIHNWSSFKELGLINNLLLLEETFSFVAAIVNIYIKTQD